MKALLIPVKDLTVAKQRLAPELSQADRTALAEAMFGDVCTAVLGARGMERVFLVSSYAPALERARAFGWELLRESIQESESDSVDVASRLCAERGVTALLRLPVDLPLVLAEDIDFVFSHARTVPSAVIVASRSGAGTNALLRTPPTLFRSRFGPDSFTKHLREAARCAAEVVILRNERLELDVDDWEDLQELLRREDIPPATKRWLSRSGLHEGALLAGPPPTSLARAAAGGGVEE